MNFTNPGTGDGKVPLFQCVYGGEKFFPAQYAGATENRLVADFDQLRHPADVIVVPVGRHDQHDGPGGVDADAFQIPQGPRRSGRVDTGVDEDPRAIADVQDDALAIAGTEKCEFELACSRRPLRFRHSPSDRIVSRAHSRPSRKSALVTPGRSRNTIWDTRFFVPDAERS